MYCIPLTNYSDCNRLPIVTYIYLKTQASALAKRTTCELFPLGVYLMGLKYN